MSAEMYAQLSRQVQILDYAEKLEMLTILTNALKAEGLKSASEISPLILTSVSGETDLLECPLARTELQSSNVETFEDCNFKERLQAKQKSASEKIKKIASFKGCMKGVWTEDALEYQIALREDRRLG